MSDGTVGGQTPTPGEIHHRLQRAIFDPSPSRIALSAALSGWLTEAEQAAKDCVSVATLRRRRARRYGPLPVQFGRKYLYRSDASEKFLEAQEMAAAEPPRGRRR
jgi:hypothetical protein